MRIVAPILFFLCSIYAVGQDWKESYADALASSEVHNKPIILVFSGSDWCAPCIKLEKNIWQSDEFKSYSKENFVLYKADFPRKKVNRLAQNIAVQNAKLADRFNPNGYFPLVVVLNSKEIILGQMGYDNGTPSEYISLLNNCLK